MNNLPEAESLPYWMTSRTDPEAWFERIENLLEANGGKLNGRAMVKEPSGNTVFALSFSFGPERFRVFWPALPSKKGNSRAARVQAATMIYHDVKERLVRLRIFGPRSAFADWLILPDGRTFNEVTNEEFANALPRLLTGGNSYDEAE